MRFGMESANFEVFEDVGVPVPDLNYGLNQLLRRRVVHSTKTLLANRPHIFNGG